MPERRPRTRWRRTGTCSCPSKLRLVANVSGDETRAVKLKLEEGTSSSCSDGRSEGVRRPPTWRSSTRGKDAEIAFNPDYVLDGLKNCETRRREASSSTSGPAPAGSTWARTTSTSSCPSRSTPSALPREFASTAWWPCVRGKAQRRRVFVDTRRSCNAATGGRTPSR